MPFPPTDPEPGLVFCRADERLAHAVLALAGDGYLTAAALSGGVGKDTANLIDQGYRSEAHFVDRYITSEALWRSGLRLPPIYLDERANNGRLNARNGMALLSRNGYVLHSMTAIAHATSLLRLAMTLEQTVEQRIGTKPTNHRKPTENNYRLSFPAY
jgi:hypothetical protein